MYVLLSSFVHTSFENPNLSTNVDAVLSYCLSVTLCHAKLIFISYLAVGDMHPKGSEVLFYVHI